jgi:hypothetical protein
MDLLKPIKWCRALTLITNDPKPELRTPKKIASSKYLGVGPQESFIIHNSFSV